MRKNGGDEAEVEEIDSGNGRSEKEKTLPFRVFLFSIFSKRDKKKNGPEDCK